MNRLTKKVGDYYCSQNGDFYDLYNKLGELEDLMEKYHIRDVEHLDRMLEEYEFAKLGKIFPSYLQQLDEDKSE